MYVCMYIYIYIYVFRQARKEFKRSIKALDHCNLCKKKVNNLEEDLGFPSGIIR